MDRTEALFREHGPTVLRICRARLSDRVEAEDATQQVFLSAHRALLGGVEPDDPEAWLATIARNECWARLRARSSQPVPALGGEDEAGPADTAGEVLLRADVAALWDEVAQLPPGQRDAFLLREVRGLSYEQLADRLALSGPAVRSLLRRARRSLRLRLQGISTAAGGLSWLEGLARAVAGTGGPPPALTKAAAVGLGAVALGGGGFLAAPGVEHARTLALAPAKTTPPARVRRHAAPHPPAPRPAPVRTAAAAAPLPQAATTRAVPATVARRRDDGRTRTATHEARETHQATSEVELEVEAERPAEATTTVRIAAPPPPPAPTTAEVTTTTTATAPPPPPATTVAPATTEAGEFTTRSGESGDGDGSHDGTTSTTTTTPATTTTTTTTTTSSGGDGERSGGSRDGSDGGSSGDGASFSGETTHSS